MHEFTRSINLAAKLDLKRECGYCKKEQNVWLLDKTIGLFRNVRKLPNGVQRCVTCQIKFMGKFKAQQAKQKEKITQRKLSAETS